MTSGSRVEPLEWDSTFWGIPAARVFVDGADCLDACDQQCRDLGIAWASLLVPIDELDVLNAAVQKGYRVVDVRQTLRRGLGDAVRRRTTSNVARPEDADAMAAIAARSFTVSRFFVDPHLDDELCEKFYDTWVRNSFNGQMADAAVVSRSDKGVDGFITVRGRPGECGSLSLVAVRADRRGHGIARGLVDDAIDWMLQREVPCVEVVTQAGNLAAVRLYEAAGFQTSESAFWLHRWFG